MTGMVPLALAAATAVGAQAVGADEAAPLIAQSCAGCHGQDGAGQGEMPAIAGYDRDEFLQVWAEFRADERPATIMNRIAPGYTDEEVEALADYFASLR
jgi:cytochrome subunit of sulfide dehydrogenase